MRGAKGQGRLMDRNLAEQIRRFGVPPRVRNGKMVLTEECCRGWGLPPPAQLPLGLAAGWLDVGDAGSIWLAPQRIGVLFNGRSVDMTSAADFSVAGPAVPVGLVGSGSASPGSGRGV